MSTPLTLIIFGATGDLARRKLFPALLDLHCAGHLPESYRMVGFAKSSLSAEEFRRMVRGFVEERGHGHPEREVAAFAARAEYVAGDFTAPEAYGTLARFLAAQDRAAGVCTNKLFYLAVPPRFYDALFQNLADSGLSVGCVGGGAGWTRLVVEKPFGEDLHTAQALERKLALLFKEDQIFRIDHYLGKSALENILAFRFANSIFEPVWNRDYVERIEVRILEERGMDGRGAFYEGVGQLRDVGQNHLLQMLALVAMEDPGTYEAGAVRVRRAEVMASLRLRAGGRCIKGQYASYRAEADVAPHSKVESYFLLEAEMDTPRWRGTPVVLESGKKAGQTLSEVVLHFREIPSCMCREDLSNARRNLLRFRVQPDPATGMLLWARKPSYTMEIEERYVEFPFVPTSRYKTHDAYEKLLLDVIEGNQTLFISSEEVEHSWRFLMPVLEQWQEEEPVIYEDGKPPALPAQSR